MGGPAKSRASAPALGGLPKLAKTVSWQPMPRASDSAKLRKMAGPILPTRSALARQP